MSTVRFKVDVILTLLIATLFFAHYSFNFAQYRMGKWMGYSEAMSKVERAIAEHKVYLAPLKLDGIGTVVSDCIFLQVDPNSSALEFTKESYCVTVSDCMLDYASCVPLMKGTKP